MRWVLLTLITNQTVSGRREWQTTTRASSPIQNNASRTALGYVLLYCVPGSEHRAQFTKAAKANKTVIAASSAAIIGVAAGYPFDSVKTRMQTEPYKSIAACVRHTYQEEGVRGFFRGMLPPIVTVSIIKSISFSVYEESKSFCKARFEYVRRQQLGSVMTLSTTAGAVSGAFIAAFSCPVSKIGRLREE